MLVLRASAAMLFLLSAAAASEDHTGWRLATPSGEIHRSGEIGGSGEPSGCALELPARASEPASVRLSLPPGGAALRLEIPSERMQPRFLSLEAVWDGQGGAIEALATSSLSGGFEFDVPAGRATSARLAHLLAAPSVVTARYGGKPVETASLPAVKVVERERFAACIEALAPDLAAALRTQAPVR